MRVSRRDNGMNKSLNNERGASIVFIALAATALLSMVALAVDVGMLFNTRSESQRAADAAALAGAGSLIVEPENANRARDVATLFGEQNTVYGELADLRTGDVDVDIAKGRVTVTVRRVNSRGNAVPTWFARVFGTDDVDVDGRAVAEVQGASRATCVKPFTIPDMWDDVNGNGSWDPGEAYDPHVHGYGSAWRDAGSPGADGSAYTNDLGRPIAIKQGDNSFGGGNSWNYPGPSFSYPWDVPPGGHGKCSAASGSSGSSCYQWAIHNCLPTVIELGQEYNVENGNMEGPTRKGVEKLVAQDSGAYWDGSKVAGSAFTPWESSPRVVVIPVFDPSREFDPGNRPIEFSNFIGVFVESVTGSGNNQQVNGRLMFASGLAGGGSTAAGAKVVRLIE
jgi:Flp pilus assembly protein TadG